MIKLILTASTCTLLLVTLSQVTSFTQAEITNEVSLEIVSTEEALIAIHQFEDWEVDNQPGENKFKGSLLVSNNTNERVEILNISSPYVGNLHVTSEKVALDPGSLGSIPFSIKVGKGKDNSEVSGQNSKEIEIFLFVQSGNGFSATIHHIIPAISNKGNKAEEESEVDTENSMTEDESIDNEVEIEEQAVVEVIENNKNQKEDKTELITKEDEKKDLEEEEGK